MNKNLIVYKIFYNTYIHTLKINQTKIISHY